MHKEFSIPFLEAVSELMHSMVGVECTLNSVSNTEIHESYVSGIVTLSGNARGQVAVTFSREAGTELVARMLGLEAPEVDEDTLRDGIGEIANIIAGSAKGKLAESGFELKLSLPSIVIGLGHHVELFKFDSVDQYWVQSRLGTYNLSIWLAPLDGHRAPS